MGNDTIEQSRRKLASPSQRTARIGDRVNRRGQRRMWQVSSVGWWSADCVGAFLSMTLAYMASPRTGSEVTGDWFWHSVAFTALVGLLAHISGLHDPRFNRRAFDLIVRTCVSVLASIVIFVLGILFLQFDKVGRYVLVFAAGFSIVFMTQVRLLVWHFSRNFAQTICFLGDDKYCFQAVNFQEEHPLPFRVRSISEYEPNGGTSLTAWAVDSSIDEIVYDSESKLIEDEELLGCLDQGIKVSSYPDFVESNYLQVPVEQIDADWLFNARIDLAHPYYHGIKRVFDVGFGIAGLVLTAPILLLVMAIIKWESPGPAIYSQVRVGRFNRPFRIYKLRSMVVEAESDGAKWADKKDNRVTMIGRLLRLTRIDEAPQFWNILIGDMSLVGPRPERPEFVEMLGNKIPFYVQRHLVKPGLTGWAQINYPYGASIDDAREKLKFDLYYVKRASIALDFQIVLRTVGAVMKGAR